MKVIALHETPTNEGTDSFVVGQPGWFRMDRIAVVTKIAWCSTGEHEDDGKWVVDTEDGGQIVYPPNAVAVRIEQEPPAGGEG
jgi:hypothetical protein